MFTASTPPRGRPRDPRIEPQIYAAALDVYADRGWYGFSREAVARRAGLGQGAVYRRWSSKAELLGQALTASAPALPPIDSGDSREDLLVLSRHYVDSYRTQVGVVGLRMVLDARTYPELAEQFNRMLNSSRGVETRAIVRRCCDRDTLTMPYDAVLEVVTGSTLSYVLFGLTAGNVSGRTGAAADDSFLEGLIGGLFP
jgi:AcrR family transcriptional regulator